MEYNIKIPRIHGIIKLYNLLPDAYKDSLKIDTWHLTVLDEIYTDSRYPADIGILPSGFPSRDEAQKVYKIAQAIISDVLELIERYPFQ